MKARTLRVSVGLCGLVAGALSASNFQSVQKSLEIPSSIASVVDAAGPHPAFILIQDVHNHPEAQSQIRAMLRHGLKRWNIQTIFLEGAWSAGETPDFAFSGLEDESLYRENVQAYRVVADLRPEALRELETARMFGRLIDAGRSPDWEQLRRLIQLRLKPADYASYLKHPYRTALETSLSKAVLAAERFYDLANHRSDIFLQKAEAPRGTGTQVLVMGGFHTARMVEEFRAKGIAYVVLSPHITEGGYDDLYAKGMLETISALNLR